MHVSVFSSKLSSWLFLLDKRISILQSLIPRLFPHSGFDCLCSMQNCKHWRWEKPGSEAVQLRDWKEVALTSIFLLFVQ